MLYPQNFETKTGFDQIRAMLLNYCISTLGKHYTHKMKFSSVYEKIYTLLEQTHEFKQILMLGQHFPESNYYDPFTVFDRIKPEGTFAEAHELGEIRSSLDTITSILTFLRVREASQELRYPQLHGLSENIQIDFSIIKEINRILDEKNIIRSNASAELMEIRKNIIQLENQAGRRINQIFSQAKKEGWVASDAELALRNGRQVIPVPAAFKRKVKGFVHDQSSTGQTVFLEPEEIFELNNELRQLELDERREIVRILKQVADFLRPFLPDLRDAYFFLGKIDFIRAKAKLAIAMNAFKPRLNDTPLIGWIKARHPLLYLAYKPLKKHVEPLDLSLDSSQRIIVISGPNAGGKSVVLKTAGMVQYMLQCGLLVPLEDYSEAGIFNNIFIDIGDEQSLENDLSTYSSHLANMRHFIRHADASTLFLIDEFGAGTEPRLGGAIAEAILDDLSDRKAFGVVTTHYANLKIFAGKKQGIQNGSMLFDTQNMRPLFRLKTGNPGSSFAFEIARTMGLPPALLTKAEEIAGVEHLDFDRQLQDLELKKMELDEKAKQLKSGDDFLSEMIDRYQKLNDELTLHKKQIIHEARQEAKNIIDQSNRIIEKTIREIRETAADKEKTKQLRADLDQFALEHQPGDELPLATNPKKQKNKPRPLDQAPVVEPGPVAVGDAVRIKGQENIGEVISLGEKDATLAFGNILMKSPLKKLEKISRSSLRTQERTVKVKYDFDINEKATEFSPNLDIRGKRAEEALLVARRFVDDAILLGVKQLKVVHGTGDGILREALRHYLKTLPEVKKMRDEHPTRGGAGCTLIEL